MREDADQHRQFSQMLQTMRDLEIELTTAIEHGDAIEQQLVELNEQLRHEIRRREEVERKLHGVLDIVNQQKSDLEILVESLAEHGDEVDLRWMARYDDIEQLTRQDGLTRIGNRRDFDEYLDQTMAQCRREEKPLSLIFCDIDFFKRYNDRYGHWEGDAALVKVAQALKDQCQRPCDKAMRYGGEEFAVILPYTDLAGAEKIALSLQQSMMAKNIPHAASPFGIVTLSIGVATVAAGDVMDAQQLVEQADDHLYAAKNQGRNRVISDARPFEVPEGAK